MPNENDEEMAEAAFAGAVVAAIANMLVPKFFEDFVFKSVKAKKIKKLTEGHYASNFSKA